MLNIVRPSFPKLSSFSGLFEKALKSGMVTNNGAAVRRFEVELTEYLGVPALCFSSGQAALMTMLRATEVEGGSVLLPSLTFCATPAAIKWAGATPAFIEIDGVCIDPIDVGTVITRTTKAVLAVDPYGICCDYKRLQEVCDDVKVPLLIDSAASFGATVKGIKTGCFGSAQIFSFHATKPFSTMEGGCIVSRDLDFLAKCARIRNFGQNDDGDCTEIGLNGKMMEVCALIGLEALNKWPEQLASRQKNAAQLQEELDDINGVTVIKEISGQQSAWLYQPILIEPDYGVSRNDVIERLKEHGIGARKYYSACHKLTAFASDEWLPNAEYVSDHVISLPLYSDMTQREIDTIVNALHNIRNGKH